MESNEIRMPQVIPPSPPVDRPVKRRERSRKERPPDYNDDPWEDPDADDGEGEAGKIDFVL